jgi:deazaflavin-dependent oxidoreductase (nitroreductase family)
VASKGGAPTNPDWYHNVVAHPRFEVEVGTRTFSVDATELDAEERPQVWARIVAERPGFGDYESKTSRVMPVLRLRPVA